MDGELRTVTGQLTFRRAVSKKLVFYDLECSSGEPASQAAAWMEVVVKVGTYGSVEDVQQLRSRLKLGDVVSVQGRCCAESGVGELRATAVRVLRAWRDSHPGEAFKPRPAPAHAAAGQRQPQQQDVQQEPAAAQQAGLEEPPAAVVQPARLAVCKYFVNTGSCAKGAACPFLHLHTGALRQSWLADMRSERQLLSSAQGFAHSGGAAAKRRRAQVIARWLVETFGREALGSGDGVLDVAGGAGGVSFELAHVHGVPCTLVEPRPLKLSKPQRRQLEAAGRAARLHSVTGEQLQQLWGERGVEGGGGAATEPQLLAGQLRSEAQQGQQEQQASTAAQLELHQVAALFGPGLWRSPGWRRRFSRGFSLVVAVHPDQATDPALEYALEAGAAFAIVPCCVFPRLFSHRRLLRPAASGDAPAAAVGGSGNSSRGGGGSGSGPAPEEGVPVESYSQLVEFLVQRGQAESVVLPFEGANIAVFRRRPPPPAIAAAPGDG